MGAVKIILLLSLIGCATAKDIPILPFERRIYQTCESEQVAEPVGKLCFRQCVSQTRVMKMCKKYYLDVKDLKNPKDFSLFYNFEFRMIKNY